MFREFLDRYLEIWRSSSLVELKEIISKDYQAREITDRKIEDFGYEQSINGWEQGFQFVKESGAEWDLTEISILPLRDDEWIVIILAAMIINGQKLEYGNLFFQTFKMDDRQNWKLVRSYIEAAVPMKNNLEGLCEDVFETSSQ
jgi:hypothetical protein